MNVEIGTEAAQFPEKDYINGILYSVWSFFSAKKTRFGEGKTFEKRPNFSPLNNLDSLN
jgi:hypothetical protein